MSSIYKMAFFRIKKIKGKEYAYIVENEWSIKGSRQKVKAYIGRVYRFDLISDVDFLEYFKIENVQDYIQNNDKNNIIIDLIEWELFKFGIRKQELSIDLKNIIIQKNSISAVFFINDGFMCSHTLKRLFEFKATGEEQADAHLLARAFVEAGIKVPKEVFVGLFSKLYKY